jgi:hypothetical protein
VPTTSDLQTHELAVNWADGKAFTKTPAGNIVSVTLGGADSRLNLFLPPAPTSVTASSGNAQASLAWTAPSVLAQTPITDYIVEYSSNSGSTWSSVAESVAITSQPTNQTASSGAATFSVTASVTPSSVSATYQWERSDNGGTTFTPVSGATSATLSLTGLTNGADNDDRYRVVVSAVGAASVTSNAVALTVPAPAVPLTYANKYGPFTHSVTGTSTVTATLTGTGYNTTETRLWLLVGTTGTLSYNVTASSQASFDIGRLYVTSASPSSNAAITAVSGEVSGTQTSSGTLSVTAGQHIVLVYTKDSEDSELNDRITATLSIA